MIKVFLNEELKLYNELTREEKHLLLDAVIDANCQVFDEELKVWYNKEAAAFSSYSVYRTKPKEYKKLDIPWEVIDEKWKWAAMDEDRELFMFEEKPTWKNNLWIDYSEDGECIQLYNILKLDTTDIIAEHSLTQRPTGSDTKRPEGV